MRHKTHATESLNETTDASPLHLILVGLVALVLLLSVVQTVQVAQLKSATGGSTVSAGIFQQQAGASAPQAPRAPAPRMVGGC